MAEAVRAMRPPEPQTQAERRCLAVGLWREMDKGEEMAVGGTRGGQIPSVPPASGLLDNRGTGLASSGGIPDPSTAELRQCQVPKCANLGSPHLPPPTPLQKKGSSQKILLANRWIEGDLN